MVQHEGCSAVAVLAGDAAGSLPTRDFLALADATCAAPGAAGAGEEAGSSSSSSSGQPGALPSPVIPHAYDQLAQWQMRRYGVTRRQLAMCASLMTLQVRCARVGRRRRQPAPLLRPVGRAAPRGRGTDASGPHKRLAGPSRRRPATPTPSAGGRCRCRRCWRRAPWRR
jgi:hypothetical protein